MSSTIKQAITNLRARIASAYVAVVDKGGTLPITQDSANLPAAIESIETDPDAVYMEDILFVDYDGTILYTYSKQDVLQLTELPACQDKQWHGITLHFVEWNMTLAEVQDGYCHDVGACYEIQDDNYIVGALVYNSLGNHTFSDFRFDKAVKIDWGDGTIDTEVVGTTAPSHTYAEDGVYTILIYYPRTDSNTLWFTPTATFALNGIKGVVMPNCTSSNMGCQNAQYAFRFAEDVILPIVRTGYHQREYYTLSRVRCLIFPRNVGALGNYSYETVNNVKLICFNHNGCTFAGNGFSSPYSLKRICYNQNGYWLTRDNLLSLLCVKNLELASQTIGYNYACRLREYYAERIIGGCTHLSSIQYTQLEKIVIPEGIKTFEFYTIWYNAQLKELHIPSSVTAIQTTTSFIGMPIEDIYVKIPDPSVVSVGANSFIMADFTRIHILASVGVEAFENATGWSAYAGHYVADIED